MHSLVDWSDKSDVELTTRNMQIRTCRLYLISEKGDEEINPDHLLSSMHAVKSKYWAKGEKLLKLNFVDCDGGDQKSETSGYLQPRELINYDSSNYTSDCKLSLLLQYEIIYIGHNITKIVVLFWICLYARVIHSLT